LSRPAGAPPGFGSGVEEAAQLARARRVLELAQRLASIWRMRSRVTLNCWPTSSSVWSVFMPMPKRIRSTRSSRGVSVASTRVVVSAQVGLDRGVDRQHRVLVLDEVAEMRILLVADRRLEG
jgi:hypothetical protein